MRRYNKQRTANRVTRPASFHLQGEALTPLYLLTSYTAVHDVQERPMNVCSGRTFKQWSSMDS